MTTDPSPIGARDLILVVDDQAPLRDLLQRMLERRGCLVVTAANGEEAVERFADLHDRIGLVLMDVQMDRMTGIEAGRHIRARCSRTRLVLMSAQVTGLSDQLKAELDLYDFLEKPFTATQLTGVLPASCAGDASEAIWIQ